MKSNKLYKAALLSVAIMLVSCASTAKKPAEKTPEPAPAVEKAEPSTWLTAPSLKKAYVDTGIFENIGFAVELPEITNPDVQDGIYRHATTITMGNEMKPQWLQWHYGATPVHTVDFTDSTGKTIKVPNTLPSRNDPKHGFGGMDTCLMSAKLAEVKMRGHVLTWHSQTFDWFFCEDYDVTKGLVKDKAEMTARHEWYIKSVLEHVAEWEAKNNGGKHVIYAWDVVNEAVADDANGTNYLRGSTNGTKKPSDIKSGCNSTGDSRWYQIYESDEFIINAYRFANKYAPKDVLLCYNDYNEYMGMKTNGIINLIKAVKAHENDEVLPTRLDVMGMQSHVKYSWPGVASYESALKKYLALGIDVHVTELDIEADITQKDGLKNAYKNYFEMFRRNAKTEGSNGITCVTIWGLNDENTWLNHGGKTFYPLLLSKQGNDYITKDAFFSVLEAAQ